MRVFGTNTFAGNTWHSGPSALRAFTHFLERGVCQIVRSFSYA